MRPVFVWYTACMHVFMDGERVDCVRLNDAEARAIALSLIGTVRQGIREQEKRAGFLPVLGELLLGGLRRMQAGSDAAAAAEAVTTEQTDVIDVMIQGGRVFYGREAQIIVDGFRAVVYERTVGVARATRADEAAAQAQYEQEVDAVVRRLRPGDTTVLGVKQNAGACVEHLGGVTRDLHQAAIQFESARQHLIGDEGADMVAITAGLHAAQAHAATGIMRCGEAADSLGAYGQEI